MKMLIAALTSILLVATVAFPQSKERTIMWPPHPLGLIKPAGDGIRSATVNEAVQIVDITVAGRSITPGQPFLADDDWLRTLTLRLKNVSGQPIVGAKIFFGLPETKIEERQVAFSLEYGKVGVMTAPDGQPPVRTDEEFEMKFSAAQYQRYLDFFGKQAGTAIFTKVWIGLITVKFDDGGVWTNGCLKAINPNASCPRAAT